MVLLSVPEVIDIVVMILIVGYIFKDTFRRPASMKGLTMAKEADGSYNLEHGAQYVDMGTYLSAKKRAWYDDLLFSVLVTAPAIVLHEFGHKIVALLFGLSATFQASYGGLVLGLFLKWFVGIIIFAPAYIIVHGFTTPLNHSLIAFAGPGINLILWLGARFALNRGLLKGHEHALLLTREINKILFILNMLPIPGFDGYQIYRGLIRTILGLF